MSIEKRKKPQLDYYHRKPRKPCPVCGIPILMESTACRKHHQYPTGQDCHNWKGGAELAHQRFLRKHQRHCKDCGKPIWHTSNYCPSCKNNHMPLRKGGRFMSKGYVVVLKREHPRTNRHGYVFEHILNWEEANGKPLPDGWIIHHLNGIKHDNRPTNLVAMPSMKHSLVLQAKAKRIQQLEALLNGQSQLL